MTKPWKCYCKKCLTEIDNFSFFIENRSFRRDFIFNKTFGIISEIDKEYYNDDSYKLIYKCKCGDKQEIQVYMKIYHFLLGIKTYWNY